MDTETTANLLLLVGCAIMAHQLLVWGRIDLAGMLHHEFFSSVFLAAGAGIHIGLRRRHVE
jgi:hypothetical protein